MKKYIFKDKTYSTFWELNKATPELVFSEQTPPELLAALGIAIVEEPDPQPTPEEVAQAELEQKIAEIDRKTSQLVAEGFDYEINGEVLHFAYDRDAQLDFAHSANACLMAEAGMTGLPESVTWNAYRADGSLVRISLDADAFLALYAGGALAHQAACKEAAGQEKAAVMAGAE